MKHGRNVHVQWSTTMWSPHRHIVIGDEVGIGPWCAFQTDVEIGNKVLIASRVAFVGSDDHRFDLVGTAIWDSPRGDAKKVVVEDDVWIGYGAILLSGARVGRGSIVGAGAVVVGAVEPYSIVVPQKAHTLRKRFSEDEQRTHERSTAKSGPRK